MNKTLIVIALFLFAPLLGLSISVPNLLAPNSDVVLKAFEVQVVVSSVSQATGYQYEFDSTVNFTSPYKYRDTSSKNGLYTRAFRKGIKVYWRARAFKPGDTSAWSLVYNFTMPLKMSINSPANNTTGSVRYLAGYSMSLYAPVTYLFEADTTLLFNSPLHIFKVQNNSYLLDTPLSKFGYTIYWRVNAINQYGDTLLWSDTSKYTIMVNPVLNGVNSSISPRVIVNWTLADLAFTEIQYDTVPDFSSPLLQTHVITEQYISRDTLSNLYFAKNYYFRLRHGFGNQYSVWSATKSGLVQGAAPVTTPTNGGVYAGLNPTFGWAARTGARAHFQLYADAGYTQLIKDTVTALTTYVYPAFLNLNRTYYTRLRYFHVLDTTPWSVHSFKTFTGGVNLGTPSNNAQNQPVRLRFNFRKQPWATAHLLEIDSGSAFTGTKTRFYILTDSFKYDGSYFHYVDTLLGYGGRYVWRVFAIMGNDTSAPSITQSLTTRSVPTLYFPQNGYIGIGTQTNALVTGITGSDVVQWQLDTSSSFSSSELVTGQDPHVPDDFQPTYVGLNLPDKRLFNATYYWRARCINRLDTGGWTSPFWFNTTTAMQLLAPADGAVNVSVRPFLNWSIQGSVSDYGYQYQLATDTNFALAQTITLIGSEVPGDSVSCSFSTQYYWRARAFHARDTSAWSSYRKFTTLARPVIPVPSLVSPLSGQLNVPLTEVTLSWGYVNGATSYDVQVAQDENFVNLAASGNAIGTGALFTGHVAGKRYWWRVRTRKDTLVSNWSTVRWFQTVPPVGLMEEQAKEMILFYPNPANDEVNIETTHPTTIYVYDIFGKQVAAHTVEHKMHQLNTAMWSNGFYFIHTQSKHGVMIYKLEVKH